MRSIEQKAELIKSFLEARDKRLLENHRVEIFPHIKEIQITPKSGGELLSIRDISIVLNAIDSFYVVSLKEEEGRKIPCICVM